MMKKLFKVETNSSTMFVSYDEEEKIARVLDNEETEDGLDIREVEDDSSWDVYTVIFVPEKLIISEKKRIWMDLLFLSKYIGALDQNEIPLIFWGQYFKLSYQIFEDLNELGFGSFIVENNFLKSNIDKIKPEKTYEWYVLQIIQTLIECQIEENEKKKKECYKKLVVFVLF